MLLNLQLNKSSISTWVLSFFAFVLVIAGLASEFFQAPVSTTKELEKYRQLFNKEQLQNVRELTFTNNIGSFTLKNEGRWILTEPRHIDANKEVISKIIATIQELKIRKIYPKDAINISNFSLDTPSLSVSFNMGDDVKHLQFGLINPIDSSTYVTLDDIDAIYHVENSGQDLEKLSLSDFVDSRIFTAKANEITSIKLYRQNEKTPRVQLNIEDGLWRDSKNQVNNETVESFISEMLAIKSSIILDRKTDDLREKVTEAINNPLYRLEFTNLDNEIIHYEISSIVNTLPDLKIEKRQNFIIKASNRQHPFLVNKSFIEVFNKNQRQFPPLSIKKLFY